MELSRRVDITIERTLDEMALVAFADMGDYITLNPDGTVTFDRSDLPPGATKAIAEINQDFTLKKRRTRE